jgi:hypothetical protein
VRLEERGGGVADDDVRLPERLLGRSEQALDVGEAAHIALDRDGTRAARLDRGHSGIGMLPARRIVDHNGGAVAAQPLRDRPPDTPRRAGNDGYLSGK